MSYLSGCQIHECIRLGEIIADPFFADSVQPNSIDIHLGRYIWIDNTPTNCRNPLDEDTIRDSYSGPIDLLDYPAQGAILDPGSFILGHTIERIGSDYYVPTLSARSTTRRLGLTVCCCAGFGDIGYVNHWTLEITNTSNFPIFIPVGMPIGQISFTTIEGTKRLYKGRYSERQDTQWTPEDMLPRPMVINSSVINYLQERKTNNV